MEKTWDDYMNDPDILDEPMGLRITHAMRLKVHDETKHMTTAEHTAYVNERARATLLRLGMTSEYVSPYAENL